MKNNINNKDFENMMGLNNSKPLKKKNNLELSKKEEKELELLDNGTIKKDEEITEKEKREIEEIGMDNEEVQNEEVKDKENKENKDKEEINDEDDIFKIGVGDDLEKIDENKNINEDEDETNIFNNLNNMEELDNMINEEDGENKEKGDKKLSYDEEPDLGVDLEGLDMLIEEDKNKENKIDNKEIEDNGLNDEKNKLDEVDNKDESIKNNNEEDDDEVIKNNNEEDNDEVIKNNNEDMNNDDLFDIGVNNIDNDILDNDAIKEVNSKKINNIENKKDKNKDKNKDKPNKKSKLSKSTPSFNLKILIISIISSFFLGTGTMFFIGGNQSPETKVETREVEKVVEKTIKDETYFLNKDAKLLILDSGKELKTTPGTLKTKLGNLPENKLKDVKIKIKGINSTKIDLDTTVYDIINMKIKVEEVKQPSK